MKLIGIESGKEYPHDEVIYTGDNGELLEVVLDLEALKEKDLKSLFDKRLNSQKLPHSSGVWRFKELILDIEDSYIVSRNEGNTNLYDSPKICSFDNGSPSNLLTATAAAVELAALPPNPPVNGIPLYSISSIPNLGFTFL